MGWVTFITIVSGECLREHFQKSKNLHFLGKGTFQVLPLPLSMAKGTAGPTPFGGHPFQILPAQPRWPRKSGCTRFDYGGEPNQLGNQPGRVLRYPR